MITIDKTLLNLKQDLLLYFRERGGESLKEILATYKASEFKLQASAVNKAVVTTRQQILKILLQKAKNQSWTNEEILKSILMLTYCSYIVMIEYRNDVWPYEYMTFSRRIGELWDPFCRICFDYPLRTLELFVPPLFSEVKKQLTTEIETYIDTLNITAQQKAELKKYYNKIWTLVTSGEIKLELDLHFIQQNTRYVVDFKSGFGSNEKGNTNRLLLVASIYRNLEQNYKCLLLVRADEDRNNNYFQTLKNSGIWAAFCGAESYTKIHEHSGFDIATWINTNINWVSDFRADILKYFRKNDLDQYLKW